MSFFGTKTSGALSTTIEGIMLGAQFQCPASALVSGVVALYDSSRTDKPSECAIYNDSANGMTLVAQTTVKSPSVAALGWYEHPYASTSAPTLISGRNYIMMVWGTAGVGTELGWIVSGTVTRYSFTATFASGAAPVSISGTVQVSGSVSIYSWYTDTSAPIVKVSRIAKVCVCSRNRRNYRLHSGTVRYARSTSGVGR